MSVLPFRPTPSDPPPDLGRAYTAEDVAREVYCGTVTARWVRRNVTWGRDQLSHKKVVWWEHPLLAGIAKHVNGGAA